MSEKDQSAVDESRRSLLKMGAGTVAGLSFVAGAGTWINSKVEGIELDEFPCTVSPDFKPMDQRNVILCFATSRKLSELPQYAYRNETFGVDSAGPRQEGEASFNFQQGGFRHLTSYKRADNGKPGYTQLDYALKAAGFSGVDHMSSGMEPGVPGQGVLTWSQADKSEHKYPFKNSKEKVEAIRTAARLFGVSKVGITRRDRRWDYDPIYSAIEEKELYWETDFPFEPKSVIVMLVEMDYEAMSTAPALPASSAAGMGYSNMALFAGSMAKFLRKLGFQAVGAGNDLGNSVAYAIAAGLGEGARNGCMITPNYGPRVRICKVYTDLELDESDYDKPRNFGIQDFCTHCKRCAESCPSQAISMDDKPSMNPTYPGGDDPEYAWHSNQGVYKWHNDAKKCFKFWGDSGSDCGACITSCPWNKPDFWHHRLIDATSTVTGGPFHTFMKQADIWFGYGNIADEKAAINFWKSGKSGDFS